jgi:hypothetical protein
MKQTAVEWLQQALEDTILTHEQIMQTIGLFEQAKEIEKQQIIDARVDGDTWSTAIKEMRTKYAELYYEETFNTNKK